MTDSTNQLTNENDNSLFFEGYFGKLYTEWLIDAGWKYLYTRFDVPAGSPPELIEAEKKKHTEALLKTLVDTARPLVRFESLGTYPDVSK